MHFAKISIIVPVYNSKKYIDRCMDALVKQTYKNIEIICIDDGSTDGSLELLNKFAGSDNRITIISQSNSGPATARNQGLKVATGDFVMFCDSDDWYEPYMCEDMLTMILRYNTDIVMCNCNLVKEYDRPELDDYHTLSIFGYNMVDEVRADVRSFLWNKIFKKNLIDKYHITFPDGYEHDDMSFVQQYLSVAKDVFGYNIKLYNYVIRENSIMGDYFNHKFNNNEYDVFYSLLYTYNFYARNGIFEQNAAYFFKEFYSSILFFYSFFVESYNRNFLKVVSEVLDKIDLSMCNIKLLCMIKMRRYKYVKVVFLINKFKSVLKRTNFINSKLKGNKQIFYLVIPFYRKSRGYYE